jgi:hypothetical protein
MAEPDTGTIPFERLKGVVEALNRLFGIILSQERLTMRDLKVEVGRRTRLLDGKDVIPVDVTASLECWEHANESLEALEELEAAIEKAGFKVSHRVQKIEMEISLPHIQLTERPCNLKPSELHP